VDISLVEVHAVPMGLLHVDQFLLPQVSSNDFEYLGCFSKCASLVKYHLGAMEMDGGVKESQVHFDFLIHVLG